MFNDGYHFIYITTTRHYKPMTSLGIGICVQSFVEYCLKMYSENFIHTKSGWLKHTESEIEKH